MHALLQYRGNFFESEDWYGCLLTCGIEPRIFETEDGLIPCKRDADWRTSSLTNFYSQEWRPLGNWRSALDQVGPRLDLAYLKDESVELYLRDSGFSVFRSPHYANWTAEVYGGFEAYFSQRPSQLKNTIKRKSKALTRDHKLELVVSHEPNVKDYVEVYNASWKQPEPFADFIPTLMRRASDIGVLRLGLAYIDGEPAAAQLWIVENRRAVIYKLAYKEKFKDTSVGAVLSHELFRHAIDVDGVHSIDYGVGDEPYKKDWMTRRGETYQLTCFNRSVLGRIGALTKRCQVALTYGISRTPKFCGRRDWRR